MNDQSNRPYQSKRGSMGKTTTSVNLGIGLTGQGKKVFLVSAA